MNSEKIFGERIKALRTNAKLTQFQLGETISLSKQAINDIENGRRTTTLKNLVLLAEFFDVSTDYLLGLSDSPKKQ